MSSIDFTQFEREFSTSEKLKAFLYHVYMATVGHFVDEDGYNNYMRTFDEFLKYQEQKKKGSEGITRKET